MLIIAKKIAGAELQNRNSWFPVWVRGTEPVSRWCGDARCWTGYKM